MKRLGRWMLNGLTVLSLLLCVATCVMWWQTRDASGVVGYQRRSIPADVLANCGGGEVAFAVIRRDYASEYEPEPPPAALWNARWFFWKGAYHPTPRRGNDIWSRFRSPPYVKHMFLSGWNRAFLVITNDIDTSVGFRNRTGKLGFDFASGEVEPLGHPHEYHCLVTACTFPVWAVVVLTGGLPFVRALRHGLAWVRRRRRKGRRECPACSYDLTGNVSGVCPECGKAIVRAE